MPKERTNYKQLYEEAAKELAEVKQALAALNYKIELAMSVFQVPKPQQTLPYQPS